MNTADLKQKMAEFETGTENRVLHSCAFQHFDGLSCCFPVEEQQCYKYVKQ